MFRNPPPFHGLAVTPAAPALGNLHIPAALRPVLMQVAAIRANIMPVGPSIGPVVLQVALVTAQVVPILAALTAVLIEGLTVLANSLVILSQRIAIVGDGRLIATAFVAAQSPQILATLTLRLRQVAPVLRDGTVVLPQIRTVIGDIPAVLSDVAVVLAEIGPILAQITPVLADIPVVSPERLIRCSRSRARIRCTCARRRIAPVTAGIADRTAVTLISQLARYGAGVLIGVSGAGCLGRTVAGSGRLRERGGGEDAAESDDDQGFSKHLGSPWINDACSVERYWVFA